MIVLKPVKANNTSLPQLKAVKEKIQSSLLNQELNIKHKYIR